MNVCWQPGAEEVEGDGEDTNGVSKDTRYLVSILHSCVVVAEVGGCAELITPRWHSDV